MCNYAVVTTLANGRRNWRVEVKKHLTKEEAISVLPQVDSIHTFYNPGFGLVGADWSREDIIDKIQKSDIIELTGSQARGLSHGICAYDKDTKYQSDILFIKTDEARMSALENKLEALKDEKRLVGFST